MIRYAKKKHNKGPSTHPHSHRVNTGDGGNEDIHKACPEHDVTLGGNTSGFSRYHHVNNINWSPQEEASCIRVEHGLLEVRGCEFRVLGV